MVTNPSEPYRQDPGPFYVRMGRVMSALRVHRNLKQTDVATRLGVSQQLVAAWESGGRRMPVDLLEPLAEALGCTTGYLLRGGGGGREQTP